MFRSEWEPVESALMIQAVDALEKEKETKLIMKSGSFTTIILTVFI